MCLRDSLAVLLSPLLSAAPLAAGDFDVVIWEIHYNPFFSGSEESDEFVELHNVGPFDVDLSGWRFREGIELTFASGVTLPAQGYLAVSPDPDGLKRRYGLSDVAGPYLGRLDNGGEVLELVNAGGRVVQRLRYDDDAPWPALADGFGPSLVFDGFGPANDLASRWRPSRLLGGTPGAPNSRRFDPVLWPEVARRVLLPAGGPFRTFKGRAPPSADVDGWTALDFDDSSWPLLPGAFGFGTEHGLEFASALSDMLFAYSTFYVRGGFDLSAEDLAALAAGTEVIELRVQYDDAFVAYLNGIEVGRANAGAPGVPIAFDGSAASSRTGTDDLRPEPGAVSLRPGRNVLAVQGLNHGAGSADFFLAAELVLARVPESEPAGEPELPLRGVLNEVAPATSAGGGSVELYNPTPEPLDLSEHVVLSSRGQLLRLAPGTVLAPGGFLVVQASSSGVRLPSEPTGYVLLAPGGQTLADALEAPRRSVPDGLSAGRHPDGSDDVFVLREPTLGGANVHTREGPVVIHEIHFHPPCPLPGCDRESTDALQWIEIHNRSSTDVDLGGWSLTKGIEYELPAGTRLAPAGFLVVAASSDAFRAAHPGVEGVVGGWSGRLSHSSDTLNLRDELGNRVDHVRYGDGGPTNDEAPRDGADDGTFVASTWPREADGSGRSLELAHASLDNRFGGSWRASLAAGGTPGAPNSAAEAEPAPAIDDVEHSPAVPGPEDPVRVSCKVSSPVAIERVELTWSIDGASGSGASVLMDAEGGNEVGEARRFSAAIPPRPDGTLVRWRISARDSAGHQTNLPQQPRMAPYTGFEGVFFLYEVDSNSPPQNSAPVFRLLMTAADRAHFLGRLPTSDVLLPAALVAGDEVRQPAGVRLRGESSRREPNRSFRVELPPEKPFQGAAHVNLIGSNGGARQSSNVNEVLAMNLFRRAGGPYALEEPVTLHAPGLVSRGFDTRYLRKEVYDERFLERSFGAAAGGDLYRARSPLGPGGPSGDLAYRGEDLEAYRTLYELESGPGDLGAIVELARAIDAAATPDAIFPEALDRLIDARQWARFFALMAALSNADGGIWNESGEDYLLYRVPTDAQRPDAGKWLLLAWDVEESFADSSERLFRPELPAIRRFLSHPRFAPLYYEELDFVKSGAFSRGEVARGFEAARVMFPPQDVFDVTDPIDAFVARRQGYFTENIASTLSAGALNAASGGGVVVAVGDLWRFLRGRRNPAGGLLDWTQIDFDDAAWEVGPTGIGVGDGDDATVLGDLVGSYTTVYARRRFRVDDPLSVLSMVLTVDYDDAYVAYLNSVEVARSASAPPAGPIVFDDTAERPREASAGGGPPPESTDVSFALPSLVEGDNVLAVVVLNQNLASGDLSLIPSLSLATRGEGEGLGGGCGDVVYGQGSRLRLRGLADPVHTRSVSAGGAPAEFRFITDGDGPYGALWEAGVDVEAVPQLVEVAAHADPDAAGEPFERLEVEVRPAPQGFRVLRGDLVGDVALDAASGPYQLVGQVVVPEGSSLTLDPGTTVLGLAGAGLVVRGRLSVQGSAAAPVRFSSFACDQPWGGIFIEGAGAGVGPVHELRFAEIEGGQALPPHAGLVSAAGVDLLIADSYFHDAAANAIDVSSGRVEVQRTLFERVYEGLHGLDSTALVSDCVFRDLVGDRDAIDLDGDGDGPSLIEHCTFDGGQDDGIDAGACSLAVRDSTFRGFADKAVSLEGNGRHGPPSLAGNLIWGCGTGIALKDGVTVLDAHHNTVTLCQRGLSLFAKDAATDGGHGVFHSTIVWHNAADVEIDAASSVEFTFSDVGGSAGGGLPWPGEGNILRDPLFVDPAGGDFSLRPGSPCIASGAGGSDMGAVPFRGAPAVVFVRGDANASGRVDISDAVATLGYLFLGAPGPACHDRMDASDDGRLDVTDPIRILSYLFLTGTPLPPPFPESGVDPSADALPCPE